jgi:hypothetical protein
MDILASMLAYLGCVTGIVGTLAISLFVFFSTPSQLQTIPTKSSHTISAKPSALKTSAGADTKPSPTSGVARVEIAHPPKIAADALAKTQIAPEQLRRLVQDERARRFAYQQNPDFEARFLGYAD